MCKCGARLSRTRPCQWIVGGIVHRDDFRHPELRQSNEFKQLWRHEIAHQAAVCADARIWSVPTAAPVTRDVRFQQAFIKQTLEARSTGERRAHAVAGLDYKRRAGDRLILAVASTADRQRAYWQLAEVTCGTKT